MATVVYPSTVDFEGRVVASRGFATRDSALAAAREMARTRPEGKRRAWSDEDFDTVVWMQQWARRRDRPCDDSEIRIRAAVLEDALRTIERYRGLHDPIARDLVADARAWIESRDMDWPFSFERICEVVGLDAGAVRARLAEVWDRGAVGDGT